MISFPEIQKQVIQELTTRLSPSLTYHNVDHTLDVLKQAELIAGKEGITNKEDLLLIKISAIYHDIGFINLYSGHEEESCRIARPELESFGFSHSQIEKVVGMI